MRIDAHQHFWRFDAARDQWITDEMRAIRRDFLPGDLKGALTANGIDGCVAVQANQSDNETRFLLDLADRHPFIRGVVGWVDLRSPGLGATLDALASRQDFAVFATSRKPSRTTSCTQDDVIRGIREVGRAGLTYDILIVERQLPAALALTALLPDQPFVIDHLAKPRIKDRAIEAWATRMRDLARRPNVFCKISGLVTEADWTGWRPEHLRPYLDVAFEAFGTDRVLFGSDWPVCLVAAPSDRVIGVITEYAGALSPSERDALFGGNAMRAYGLL